MQITTIILITAPRASRVTIDLIISICEYRLTPKVAAKNPKPLVKMDLIEVLWAIPTADMHFSPVQTP